jgi:hypothetical protein
MSQTCWFLLTVLVSNGGHSMHAGRQAGRQARQAGQQSGMADIALDCLLVLLHENISTKHCEEFSVSSQR